MADVQSAAGQLEEEGAGEAVEERWSWDE